MASFDFVRVKLGRELFARTVAHAHAIVQHFDALGRSGGANEYGHNRVTSNVIGTKCEVATAIFVRGMLHNLGMSTVGVLENFWAFDGGGGASRGDVNVGDGKAIIEVKALGPQHWDKLSCCVPPRQVESYAKNRAIIIWAVTGSDEASDVKIMGWSMAEDMKRWGYPFQSICANIRLPIERMRHIATLPGALTQRLMPTAATADGLDGS